MFTVHICKDYDEMSRVAYEVMREEIEKGEVTLGLATGSSPEGMYKYLVEAHKKDGLSFKGVKSFNLDEYVGLDANHPQSYAYFMNHHLFSHVDIDPENVHLPKGTGDVEAQVKAYEAMLEENPQDIQLLGIGSNGHIGFNEPGSSFESVARIEKLKEDTIQANSRFFDSIDEVPKQAVTMGIKDIMRAKKILLVASGEKKSWAIKELLHGEVREEAPCTVLQRHPHVTVVIDEAAASFLND